MQSQPIKWRQIENVREHLATRLRMSEPRPNKSGMGKSASLMYVQDDGTEVRLCVQAPRMVTPFGAGKYEGPADKDGSHKRTAEEMEASDSQKAKKERWSISLNLTRGASAIEKWTDFVTALDECMVTLACKAQRAMFGEDGKPDAVIEDRYTKLVNNKNPKYDPRFSPKLDVRDDGTFAGTIFDNQNNEQPLSFVTRGSQVIALVEFSTIWIADKKFGLTCKALQMKVTPPLQLAKNAIVDEDEDEIPSEQQLAYGDEYGEEEE